MTAKEELLLKLKALSERGMNGERKNATAMLQRLMDKYGITEEQLNTSNESYHWFKYTTEMERKLFCQICYMVTGTGKNIYLNHSKKKQRACKCTDAQSIEIDALYSFYRARLKEDLELFYNAFVQRNDIFPQVAEAGTGKEMNREELEKILSMAGSMEKHSFYRELEYRG